MASLLVLDSDEDVRKLISLVLREGGHQVIADRSFTSNLDSAQLGAVDLIFCEVGFLAAADLARVADLRRLFPDAKIVGTSAGISGNDPEQLVRTLPETGLVGILSKPFSVNALLHVTREVLRSGQ